MKDGLTVYVKHSEYKYNHYYFSLNIQQTAYQDKGKKITKF
jgi:hypothetical protein